MRFAIFGLTVSSSWGNGHATPWRGLLKALRRLGHRVTFFERDVPYYAAERDLPDPDFCELVLYKDWMDVRSRARAAIAGSDVAIVTSFCADGLAACRLMLDSHAPRRVFYDLDTPITLGQLRRHGVAASGRAAYLVPELIPELDLYLSFTGGPLLEQVQAAWGARRVAHLPCSVDPEVHAPARPVTALRCSLGYLATYAADRQATVEALLIEPARRRPGERFWVMGALYPETIAWPPNVTRRSHLAPAQHAAFYCSSRLTLNTTRSAMREAGYSPSGRLFEAASCGAPLLSDAWPGLDELFTPGEEILIARDAGDTTAALGRSDAELRRIGLAARARALAAHTGEARAWALIAHCEVR